MEQKCIVFSHWVGESMELLVFAFLIYNSLSLKTNINKFVCIRHKCQFLHQYIFLSTFGERASAPRPPPYTYATE